MGLLDQLNDLEDTLWLLYYYATFPRTVEQVISSLLGTKSCDFQLSIT